MSNVKPKLTLKERLHDLNTKAKQKAGDMIIWCGEHKEAVATALPIIIGVTSSVVKTITKKKSRDEIRELKDEYIYDRRAGHYIQVRRQPTNSEWIEIDRRYQAGENYSQILMDMRLLK